MSYRFIVVLLGLFIITAVVSGVVYFEETGISLPTVGPPPAEPAEPTAATPGFHLTSRTTERIAGILNEGSSHVEFEGRMESPSHVSVQVRVNDLVLDASAELGKGGQRKVVIVDGYGKTVSPGDKQALIALGGELERYLDPYRRQLPPHEDLLMRVVSLGSEAPVGYTFRKREIRL